MRWFYVGINNFMHKHPFISSCVYFAARFTPWMVAIFYFLFLLKMYLAWGICHSLMMTIIKPASVLLLTGCTRLIIDRQRPYEKYKYIAIDEKKRVGHSFPSIHASCAFSIAIAVLMYGPNMGMFLLALAIIIACSRLFTGVHYVTDLLGGILVAYAVFLV